jgi:AraC family transcriptional regulator
MVMLSESRVLRTASPIAIRGHDHSLPHFCAVIDGCLHESDRRDSHTLSTLDVRLSPPAKRDLQFGHDGATCLISELDAACVEVPPDAVYAAAPSWASAALRDLCASRHSEGPSWRLDVDLLTSDLVSWMTARRRASVSPRWLLRVRDAVREGDPLEARRLAAEAGVHRVHLSRSFHDHFGLPLSAYVQRVRALRALHLLRQPDLSLAEVASGAGYFDQAHFCRWAVRLFGRSPATLRATLQSSKTNPVSLVDWLH